METTTGSPAASAVSVTVTDDIVARANREVEVTDRSNRKIVLKRPNVLEQYRLVEHIGAEAAQNHAYVAMCTPLLYVKSIDGVATPPPQTKLQLEAFIQQLDDEGVAAVMEGVQKHFGETVAEQAREAAKK